MNRKKLLLGFAIFVVLVLLYAFNMVYFSIKPDLFSVEKSKGRPNGVVFTDVAVKLIENELNSAGGWVPNDIPLSPTWYLDNKPNFQMGILEVLRYSSRVLRDNLSRQRTTGKIDPDCEQAFTSFSNDPYKWIIPSAEGKYKKGIVAFNNYIQRLDYGNASFYPRSDNLIQLLQQYVSLLGGVNTRLLNASLEDETQSDLLSEAGNDGRKKAQEQKVAWVEIDDNFYYAQGAGYALYHMLMAIRIEFAPVLKDKNAEIIMDEIIVSLKESYFEPLIITNGSKNGILANHSSNLRVFLDDARQKINSLINILDQG